MDENPYRPPSSNLQPPPPTREGLPPLPWEERDRIGFGTALWETFLLFLKDPEQAYARARDSADYGSPMLYALIVGSIGGVIGQLWRLLSNLGLLSLMGDDSQSMLGAMGVVGIFGIICVPVGVMIGLFFISGLVHLSLLITGGLPDSPGGFEGTLRSQGYASTTQAALLVPMIGGLIAFIWSLVLLVIGLKRMHGISTGRAVVGVLLPFVAFCGLFMILILLAVQLPEIASG